MTKGFWTCPKCETQNPIDCKVCEVCELERPDDQSPSEIVKFVSKTGKQVKRGQRVHLVWETKYTKHCYINDVLVSGSGEKDFVVEPQFVLKSKNDNDIREKRKTIKFDVLPNPKVVEFNVSKTKITRGESVVISWKTEDISEVLLDGTRSFTSEKSITLSPNVDCSYSFCFIGINGEKINKDVSVVVTIPKPIIQIIEKPEEKCQRGSIAIISWKSKFVEFVEFRGKKYGRDDSVKFILKESIHEALIFHGEDGHIYSRQVDIDAFDPIKIIYCTDALTLRAGEEGVISWNAENVDYVLLDTKTQDAKDEYKIRATNNTNPVTKKYSLQFVNKYQTTKRIVEVRSLPLPPNINSLNVDKQFYIEGETIHITWSSENVKSVSFTDSSKTYASDDSCDKIANISQTSFTAIFHGADKTDLTRTVTVYVYPKPKISCRGSKTKVNKKEDCYISWDCQNVSKVICDGVRYKPKDRIDFKPHETFTKRIDFYDLKGNLCASESKTIEVETPPNGCGKAFLYFLLFFSVFGGLVAIGSSLSTGSSSNSGVSQYENDFNKHLSDAGVDNIVELEAAYNDLQKISNHRSVQTEKDKLRSKARSIKKDIESSPVRNLPQNKDKTKKIDALLRKL